MKKILVSLFILFQSVYCFAGHIAGGEIFYQYIGPGVATNSSQYAITLRLFRECNPVGSAAPLPTSLAINIYNNTNPSTQFGPQVSVGISGGVQILNLTAQNPCIVNPVPVCYQVANYQFTTELPNTPSGYIVTYQTCCRSNSIFNVQTFAIAGNPLPGEGATYSCEIPGTDMLPAGHNSSAAFILKDTTLVCKLTPFTLDFSATDPDNNDSLSYSFCAAYDRGQTNSAFSTNYVGPPFNQVTYVSGFSGTQPLGPDVTINPVTGIISGKAPDAGYYVVNVCITERRNGVPISFHRKDFTLRVADCSLTAASLKPAYITCNGTTLSFQNESTSSNITSYLWNFGVPSLTTDTSTNPTPTYDYLKSGKDSGTYTIRLKVTSAAGCQDSTTAQVKIYPGFVAKINVSGTCYLNNYKFFDASTNKYGQVNSWRWNFGDSTTLADTAISKDSAWKYPGPTSTQIRLIVGNSKGCIDTVTQALTILDRPSLNLPFRDTLICSNDSLLLKVNISSGSVLWTPMNGPNKTRIANTTSPTPLVFPRDTTKYYVSVNDNGCANSDSVTVNVLQFITVKAGTDTGICRTDSFRLRPISDALSYQWTASTGEKVQAIKSPLVKPLVNTRYYVLANLGKCQSKDSVLAKVAPYPTATVGSDMTICFGSRVQLNGAVTGSVFSWSPTNSLINENTLTPTAGPTKTTAYILTATDTIGCPKPKSDTIIVTVIPLVTAYAGKDTIVLPNQPLQLIATGGITYTWSPTTGLNDPNIFNPIATLSDNIDAITYTVRVTGPNGCFSEDQVLVTVYKSSATIFVPSAFTPNGDGKNDALKPITVGISKLNYFSIYNRWGQLLFTTTEIGKAWDGSFNGVTQPSGTYVYQAEGTDFLGNSVFKKGTVVLIR